MIGLFPDLHETTSRNLRNRKGRAPRCQDVESVCADATTHPLPSGPVLLFLFNPFREEALLERFLSHVERSWKASPRPIVLVYVNARLAFVFERFPLFQKLAPLWDDCLLYRTPDPSADVGRPDEQGRRSVLERR